MDFHEMFVDANHSIAMIYIAIISLFFNDVKYELCNGFFLISSVFIPIYCIFHQNVLY